MGLYFLVNDKEKEIIKQLLSVLNWWFLKCAWWSLSGFEWYKLIFDIKKKRRIIITFYKFSWIEKAWIKGKKLNIDIRR